MALAVLFPRVNLDIELEFLRDYLDDGQIKNLRDFGDRILTIITPIISIDSSDEIERLIPSIEVELESLFEEYLRFLQDALKSRTIGFTEFSHEFNKRLSHPIEEMLKEFEGLLNPDSYHRLIMAMDDKRRLDAWLFEQLRIGDANNIEQYKFRWAESDTMTAHTVFLGIIAILAERENTPSLPVLIDLFYKYTTGTNRVMDGLPLTQRLAQTWQSPGVLGLVMPLNSLGFGLGRWDEEDNENDTDEFLEEVRRMRQQD